MNLHHKVKYMSPGVMKLKWSINVDDKLIWSQIRDPILNNTLKTWHRRKFVHTFPGFCQILTQLLKFENICKILKFHLPHQQFKQYQKWKQHGYFTWHKILLAIKSNSCVNYALENGDDIRIKKLRTFPKLQSFQ